MYVPSIYEIPKRLLAKHQIYYYKYEINVQLDFSIELKWKFYLSVFKIRIETSIPNVQFFYVLHFSRVWNQVQV